MWKQFLLTLRSNSFLCLLVTRSFTCATHLFILVPRSFSDFSVVITQLLSVFASSVYAARLKHAGVIFTGFFFGFSYLAFFVAVA